MNKVRSLFHIVDKIGEKVRKVNSIFYGSRQCFPILEKFIIQMNPILRYVWSTPYAPFKVYHYTYHSSNNFNMA